MKNPFLFFTILRTALTFFIANVNVTEMKLLIAVRRNKTSGPVAGQLKSDKNVRKGLIVLFASVMAKNECPRFFDSAKVSSAS